MRERACFCPKTTQIRAQVLTNRAECGTILFVSQHPSPALTAERRTAIARIVAQGSGVRVAALAVQFGKNTSTIRRDLVALERQGMVQRVHGGAVPADSVGLESAPAARVAREVRIGQAVSEMIVDGETVFLGPGPLPLEVARSLTAHSRLTVVTNGLGVAHWVAGNTPHNLIVTGGQVEGRDSGMVGHLTRAALASLRADHVVLELGGVSAVGGVTDDSLPQAEIARMLLETGLEIIVLVLPERVGQVAAAYIAPASDVDVIVTAREASSPFLWDLSELGVRIVLA